MHSTKKIGPLFFVVLTTFWENTLQTGYNVIMRNFETVYIFYLLRSDVYHLWRAIYCKISKF